VDRPVAAPPTRRRLGSRFAVLGMLGMGLETGYAMKKHVETQLSHFWSESYGRIYPILRELVAEGLATCEPEVGPGRRRRNRYALTRRGRDALNEWLAEPPQHQPPRHELLLKLSFGRHAPRATTRRMIEAHREACRRAVEAYAGLEARIADGLDRYPDQPFWTMTIRCGRAVREAERVWCEDALEILDGLEREAPAGAGEA